MADVNGSVTVPQGAGRYASLAALLAGAIVLLAVPTLVQAFMPTFYLALFTEILIMGLFALGYDLLMGYTGMISFGHAAFFGLGAYGTGLMLLRVGAPPILALPVGIVSATLAALVIGFFSIRLKSVYFALLTFAFAQIFYQGAVTWTPFTGGYDGVALSMPMRVSVPGVFEIDLRDRTTYYYVVLAFVAITFVIARRIVDSPFGRVLVTIRENETRAATLGYNVARYKQAAFIVSGLVSGLAGGLFVPYQKFVSPDLLFWELGGLVIIMVLVGGRGTLWGPLIGAAVVVFLRDWLTAYTKHHLLLLGLIFVLVVMFAPGGLASIITGSRRVGWRGWRLPFGKSPEQGARPVG